MNETEHSAGIVGTETNLTVREGRKLPDAVDEKLAGTETETVPTDNGRDENVFRRNIKEDPYRVKYARHRLWLDSLQHEYPLPYVAYRVGVYIRFFNQTKYSDAVYLEKHKSQFREDIACCPKWQLVDFYIDSGSTAPGMEHSKEWLRLLDDCLAGKVDLIVTQKVSNVSSDPGEITFVAKILANQDPPIGIYFISEDIFTLASYYRADRKDEGFVPPGWTTLPPDQSDNPALPNHPDLPGGDPAGTPTAGEVV